MLRSAKSSEECYTVPFKKNKTYSFEEVKEKINIELYWNELIYNKYNKLVKIDENLLLEKIKNAVNEEQKEYNLLEIVFQKSRAIEVRHVGFASFPKFPMVLYDPNGSGPL